MVILQVNILKNHSKKKVILLNQDNQRLKEIKEMLSVYYYELDKSDSISDCLKLQEHIDKLENEEKQILARCDVII